MGYRGGSLVDLFKEQTTQPPTRALLRAIADEAGAEIKRRAATNTPVDTGVTRSRWEQIPVRRVRHESGLPAYESGARNPHYKARWLEYGVEPHEIEGPRGTVHHPGFAGKHMLAEAMSETEAALGTLAAPRLQAWAVEVEQRAKRHEGIS